MPPKNDTKIAGLRTQHSLRLPEFVTYKRLLATSESRILLGQFLIEKELNCSNWDKALNVSTASKRR